jgi:ribonuclease HII
VARPASPRLRPSLRGKAPGLVLERNLWAEGYDVVAGIDEVGRGAWAGPLTLAAVVVPRQRRITRVRD